MQTTAKGKGNINSSFDKVIDTKVSEIALPMTLIYNFQKLPVNFVFLLYLNYSCPFAIAVM